MLKTSLNTGIPEKQPRIPVYQGINRLLLDSVLRIRIKTRGSRSRSVKNIQNAMECIFHEVFFFVFISGASRRSVKFKEELKQYHFTSPIVRGTEPRFRITVTVELCLTVGNSSTLSMFKLIESLYIFYLISDGVNSKMEASPGARGMDVSQGKYILQL